MEFSKEAESDHHKRRREMEVAAPVIEAEAKRLEAEREKLLAEVQKLETEMERMKIFGPPPAPINPEIELARVMNQRLWGLAIILGGTAVAVSLIISGRF